MRAIRGLVQNKTGTPHPTLPHPSVSMAPFELRPPSWGWARRQSSQQEGMLARGLPNSVAQTSRARSRSPVSGSCAEPP